MELQKSAPPSLRRGAWIVWLIYLVVGLVLLPEYGPTFDAAGADYAYGESIVQWLVSGGESSPDLATPAEFSRRVPHPELSRGFGWFQLYPFANSICAASARLFFHALGWLPAFVAWHLPILLGSVLLVFVMLRFLAPRLGSLPAVLAGVFLITTPRYFAHAFNNIKDAPETLLYSLSVGFGYLALSHGRWRDWLLLGIFSAAALAQKANALFIPVQLGLYFVLYHGLRRFGALGEPSIQGQGPDRVDDAPPSLQPTRVLLALLLAGLVYLGLSPMFWHNTVERLWQHFDAILSVGNTALTFGTAPVLMDGFLQVLWTTPVTLLIFALIGAVAPGIPSGFRLFLLLSVAVPIGRTMLPGMRNFDGVRHFLEFLPPLCALAGHGMVFCMAKVLRRRPSQSPKLALLVALVCVLPGALRTALSHPHGIASFNLLRGGLAGAQAAGTPDATDYWGGSYWQGLAWLAKHTDTLDAVVVTAAPHVARCGAPLRLRPGQKLVDMAVVSPGQGLFVMYITHPKLYGAATCWLELNGQPVKEIRVEDAPILKIHHVREPIVSKLTELWRRYDTAWKTVGLFNERLLSKAPKQAHVTRLVLEEAAKTGRRVEAVIYLRKSLPPSMRENLDVLVDEFAWLQANYWLPLKTLGRRMTER